MNFLIYQCYISVFFVIFIHNLYMLLESPHILGIYNILNGLIASSPFVILTLNLASSCFFMFLLSLSVLPDRSGLINFIFNTVMEHRKH